MNRSLLRSLLGASLFSAVVVFSARAQDSITGFTPVVTTQGQPAATVLNEGTPNAQVGPFNVCLLQSAPGFETSAALLFLQPSSGNLTYATLVNPLPFLNPSWSDQAVNPGFSPAFNVGMRYLSGSGGDVQLAWTHLNAYDNGSILVNPTQVLTPYLTGVPSTAIQGLGPSYLIGPPPPYSSARAVAHVTYDTVNLDAGLLLGAGNRVQLRLFAGLQGARLGQSLSTTFQSPDGSITFTDASRSLFTGVGPRLGMDVHYVSGNLDLLCGLAGTTLIGGMQSNIDFLTSSPTFTVAGVEVPNTQSLTSPPSTRVIPGIDARLGASYAIPLGRFGVLKCEAGYQAAAYLGAVNQYSLTEVQNSLTLPYEGNAAVFLRTAVEYQSNFLVHGPYGRLSLQF